MLRSLLNNQVVRSVRYGLQIWGVSGCLRPWQILALTAANRIQARGFHLDLKRASFNYEEETCPQLQIRKVLVISKLSRYGYERMSNPDLTEKELLQMLATRGPAYAGLKVRHDMNADYIAVMKKILKSAGVKVKVVSVADMTEAHFKDVDAVLSAGGDGTLLCSAAFINSPTLPIIGINTDSSRSEGYMCLHQPGKRAPKSFHALWPLIQQGKYEWLHRRRIMIRIKHAGSDVWEVLPRRALNDVDFGETDASMPIYYHFKLGTKVPGGEMHDEDEGEKQKCTGVLVSTGTGSTAWMQSTNKIYPDQVSDILELLPQHMKTGQQDCGKRVHGNNVDLKGLTQAYNKRFIFSPEDPRLYYTIREPIENGIFNVERRRGFFHRLFLKSRSASGRIIMDGVEAFPWANGDVAEITSSEDDSILSLCLTN